MAFTYTIRTNPIEYAGRIKVVYGDFTVGSGTTTGDVPSGLKQVDNVQLTITSITGVTTLPAVFGSPPYTSATVTFRATGNGTTTAMFAIFGS